MIGSQSITSAGKICILSFFDDRSRFPLSSAKFQLPMKKRRASKGSSTIFSSVQNSGFTVRMRATGLPHAAISMTSSRTGKDAAPWLLGDGQYSDLCQYFAQRFDTGAKSAIERISRILSPRDALLWSTFQAISEAYDFISSP